MNASVNASLPSCIHIFSAHGLAVLHLSKEKMAPLLVELKKGLRQKSYPGHDNKIKKKKLLKKAGLMP
jgi:hypothetical protein